MQQKKCKGCGKVKPLSEYHLSVNTKDGHYAQCKPCTRAKNTAWRRANKGKVAQCKRRYFLQNREAIRQHQKEYMATRRVEASEYRRRWNLAKRYGITMEQYADIWERQGQVCGVCGQQPKKAVVDHDHKTGAVRGILCVRCNVSIGSLGDSVEGVTRAVRYLKEAENVG
jgi:hypothetical protein